MKLLVLIVNRLAWLFPTVLGLVAITFIISHIIPADPVAFVAGDNATNEQIEQLRRELGLDQPVHVQLARYVVNVLKGDLGVSLYTLRPISEDLISRLPDGLNLVVTVMTVARFLTVKWALDTFTW